VLCAELGYERVSIAQISSRAGVSSATFYEQFSGKEDCMIEAYRQARARIFRQISPVAPQVGVMEATRVTLGALLRGIQADPDAGRLLFVEALAGGPTVRAERERALQDYEAQVEAYLDSLGQEASTLDIPVAALEGARRYIVSRQLRIGAEDRLPNLAENLLSWVRTYLVPARRGRWSSGPEASLAHAPAFELPPPDLSGVWSERLPRGRHGLPPSFVARSQRLRIITAAADVLLEKGYTGATVSDIVSSAGVSRDVFYENFADKQDVFLETQQFATQYVVDTCAAAYFREEDWPMRVWAALGTLLTLIATFPAFAHVRLVECYAAGPASIRISEEVLRSAGIFLEQGFTYREEGRALPRLSAQAITGGVLEIIYRHVARGEAAILPLRLPQLSYIVLAPFTGAERAVELVRKAIAAQPLAGGQPSDGR